MHVEQLDPNVSAFHVNNVAFVRETGTNIFCEMDPKDDAGTVLFVSSKYVHALCPLFPFPME